jgi:hypothetical protein
MKKELKLRKESLLVRNELIKILKDVFDLEFNVWYNDLYWRLNNIEVRRLKGNFNRDSSDEVNNSNFSISKEKYYELKKFISEYNFKDDFKVELNLKKGIDYEKYDWNVFDYIIKIEYKDEREK